MRRAKRSEPPTSPHSLIAATTAASKSRPATTQASCRGAEGAHPNSKAQGRYDKSDFVYEPERDAFRCPAGEYAIRRFTSVEKGMAIHKYWSSACPRCALRAKCTTSDDRRISRWEHEAVLDKMQGRLDANPEAMQVRRRTAEHPFGTIKARMGATHFLCRRLPRVSAEMSLHVLAYNLKRVMKIMGTGPLIEALRA